MIGAALAVCAATQSATAATIIVNTTQDVVAVDGSCSLREAITSVNKRVFSGNLTGECAAGDGTSDTIKLPAGTYTLTIPGTNEDDNASGDLDVRTNVTITGAGMGQTIVDASGVTDRVLDLPVAGISLTLRDLTIENGHPIYNVAGTGGSGGGINAANGADMRLTHVELASNRSADGFVVSVALPGADGGAVFADGGTLVLSSCSVHDNRSGTGGGTGIAFEPIAPGGNGGALALHEVIVGIELTSFDRNQTGNGGSAGVAAPPAAAGFGGAIDAIGGSMTVLRSAFDSNHTGSPAPATGDFVSSGGAVAVSAATVQFTQTSLTRNLAAFEGGGIISGDGSMLSLDNVTLSGNSARHGAGLVVSAGSAQLDFVTLSANQASQSSGGLSIDGSGAFFSTAAFRNSIIAGNTAPFSPDCGVAPGSTLTSLGYNLSGADCPADNIGDQATTTPRLGPLGANGGIGLTQMPAPDGPAVDAGNCLVTSTSEDQRGHLRFVDVPHAPNAADACDIGAVELDDDIFSNGLQ